MGSDEREPTEQDRSLREMDEADLESARERALEKADDETVRLIDEEFQVREQEEAADTNPDCDAQPDQSAQGEHPIPGTTPTTQRSLEALKAVEQTRNKIERRRQARRELGLGEMIEDPAPEIDARVNRNMGSRRESEEAEGGDLDLFWLPPFITIPLLLTFPFTAFSYWGGGALWELLHFGFVVGPAPTAEPTAIFFLALFMAVVYYLGAVVVYLYRWVRR
jgi:hypothetical protein